MDRRRGCLDIAARSQTTHENHYGGAAPFWSFQRVKKPSLPQLTEGRDWATTDIDRFLLAKMQLGTQAVAHRRINALLYAV